MVRLQDAFGGWALLAVAVLLAEVSVDAQRPKAARPPAKAAAKNKPAPAPPTLVVSVVGLKIVAAPIGASEYGELTAFSASPGIEVALGVKAPEGYTLIDADEDESAVETMVDQQGRDLAIEPSFGFSPDFTKAKDALITTLRVGGLPGSAAREFTLRGHLSVQAAGGDRVTRVNKVPLTVGHPFKVGTADYTVEQVEGDADGVAVTLAMTRAELALVKEIRFLDQASQPLQADLSMHGYSMGDAQMIYRITGAPKVVTLDVVRYENMTTQKVPFTFTIGLGLAR